jgi:cytoskeletal protein CcmA (bactofilin family)
MFMKKGIKTCLLVAAILLTLLVVSPVYAADMRSGDRVTVALGETINDDLYVAGENIVVDGTVNGDVIAAGGTIIINGTVAGSITAAGRSVVIKGRVGNSVRVAGTNVSLHGAINGDLVAFGSAVTTSPEGSVGRDLFTASGSLHINGPVARNLKGSTGKLIINNKIGGNVDMEIGEVILQPSAHIAGSFKYTSESEAVLEPGAVIAGETKHTVPEKKDTGFGCMPVPKAQESKPAPGQDITAATVGAAIGAVLTALFGFMLMLAVIGIVLKYAMALLTGIILILLFRRHIPAVTEAMKSRPWPCLGYGALKFFIAPIGIAILLITIVGIPLGLSALALYLILIYLSPIVFSVFLGRWMLKQPADATGAGKLIGALALGLLVLDICELLPGIGCLAWLAAVLFGLGMIVIYCREQWLKG